MKRVLTLSLVLLIILSSMSIVSFADPSNVPNDKANLFKAFGGNDLYQLKTFKTEGVVMEQYIWYTDTFLEDADTFMEHYWDWWTTRVAWTDEDVPPEAMYMAVETTKMEDGVWFQYEFELYDMSDPDAPPIYTWNDPDHVPPYGIGYRK